MGALPLWLRWVLTLLVFGALAVVGLSAVQGGGGSAQDEAAAPLEANRAARTVIVRDQAPRSAALPAGVAPKLALERAIRADVRGRVRRDRLTGPAQSVRCSPAPPAPPGRRPFRCGAKADGIRYPFRGVVDLRTGRMTWCKFDPVPSGEVPVPLSPRCKA